MQPQPISDRDFDRIRELAMRHAGISMAPSKRTLVESRLRKRLVANGFAGYGEYVDLLSQPASRQELQTAIDLLTTNETSFFREPKHFQHLHAYALECKKHSGRFRTWSAACSTGEEPYTIAMVLADALGWSDWDVAASDLSTQVLARAKSGHYSMDRARTIPRETLHKYCLKGTGEQSGTFLMDAPIRQRVHFTHANLLEPATHGAGAFDVIFLRNVMIYFDLPTKRKVIGNLLPALKPGGIFYIGHSETLNGVTTAFQTLAPAVYRKPL
jgi:chemotaxis protein methyltransferase CheR